MLRTSRIVGALTATILAGSVLSALPATATTDPRGWAPDANVAGGMFLFDANGYQLTSGKTSDSPMAGFYEGAGGALAGGVPTNKAVVMYATPVQGQNSSTWATVNQVTANQTQPLATLPGDLLGASNFVIKGNSTDGSFGVVQEATFPNSNGVTGFAGLYEIRMYVGGANLSNTWYSAVVSVSGSNWAQVWPVMAATSVINVPASPNVASGAAVDLTATATTSVAGNVIFKEGSTVVTGPAAVNTATGQATAHITGVADGVHHYTAYFYPTPNFTTPSAPSVSSAATVTVGTVPADNTAAALTVIPGSGYSNVSQSIKAVVTDSTTPATTPAGTVAFYDNGSLTAIPGTVTQAPAGTFTLNTLLATGAHSIVAKFTPTDASLFNASQSTTKAFSLAKPPTVPAAPFGLVTIPKAKSVTVGWRVPANGGSAINQYQVLALPRVGTVFRQCTSTTLASCTVLGLLNGVSYRFEVRAHNAIGWGPYSALSAPTIPGAPTAPRGLIATFPGAKITRVAWIAPLYNGGYPVNLYQVRWSTNGLTWSAWANNGTTPAVVHLGLPKGKFAWVQVRARNTALLWSPAATLRFVPTK